MQLRYGMNPHQDASITLPPGPAPVRVISGMPSAINMLDALSGWQLVREVAGATGAPAAASFKHVSPAGVAVAGPLDLTAQGTWSAGASPGPLTSAYIRARDADPKSSFGDMIAVSEPVDSELAAFLCGVVADGIIAPGFEPGTAGLLPRRSAAAFSSWRRTRPTSRRTLNGATCSAWCWSSSATSSRSRPPRWRSQPAARCLLLP